MRIVQIEAESNGGHPNCQANVEMNIPTGWAVVPEGLDLRNFPFGEVEASEINGVMTVTQWTPGMIPATANEGLQWADVIEAQVTYTAMMTDTLLEN